MSDHSFSKEIFPNIQSHNTSVLYYGNTFTLLDLIFCSWKLNDVTASSTLVTTFA